MFKKAIVIDIITNPGLITDDIINKLTKNDNSLLRLSKNYKSDFIRNLPANSIIGYFINSKSVFIALPFFSSHMSLPLKIQEEVWIYEDPSAIKDVENEYYWVSRIHGTNFYEDLNYTHSDRKYLRSYDSSKLNNKNDLNIPVALFNNGPIRFNSNGKSGDNVVGDKEKRILENFNLSSNHLLEDVPRSFKNPGDYILQGSNNTLIRLGTNHIRKSNNNFKEEYYSTIFSQLPESYSGTIDLVAGRAVGSQDLSVNKKTVNYIKDESIIFSGNITDKAYKNSQLSIYNDLGISENLKDANFYLKQKSNAAEGDPDFLTDISRILISEYINGDELLNYSNLYSINNEGKHTVLDNRKKQGFIIAKSDEIRLIARAEIIGKTHSNNYQINTTNNLKGGGSIRLLKEGDFEDRGYIVIDSTGNISIDGPAVVLGDKVREKENGKGDGIYLGNNAVEPGVLGYMLKNKLENFMDETIRALNIIGLCLKDLDTHVHSYAGPAGQTLQPMKGTGVVSTGLDTMSENTNFLSYESSDTSATERSGAPGDIDGNYGVIGSINASSKKLEDKIKGITEIRDSLNEILSKMVKTL